MSGKDTGRQHSHSPSWENQPWALLNSGSDMDDKSTSKKLLRSRSNSPSQPPGKKRAAADVAENGKVAEGKSGGVGESDHEIHIWTERERRKKMRNMFANLHALLPQLPPKADKSTIVDEAVNYIKTLQQTAQKLQKQKLERLNNNVSPFGYDPLRLPSQSSTREAFLADQGSSNDLPAVLLSSAHPPRNYSAAAVFQTWTSSNVVLSICGGDAQISVCSPKKPGLFATVCYVLEKHKIEVVSAHISSDFNRSIFMIQAHANGRCDEFGAAMVAEDIFKQAAGEIIFWLSS